MWGRDYATTRAARRFRSSGFWDRNGEERARAAAFGLRQACLAPRSQLGARKPLSGGRRPALFGLPVLQGDCGEAVREDLLKRVVRIVIRPRMSITRHRKRDGATTADVGIQAKRPGPVRDRVGLKARP